MKPKVYRLDNGRSRGVNKKLLIIVAVVLVLLLSAVLYKVFFSKSTVLKSVNNLQFDSSVTDAEKEIISKSIKDQSVTYNGSVTVKATTSDKQNNSESVLEAYVPVTDVYSTRQSITKSDLSNMTVGVSPEIDENIYPSIAEALGIESAKLQKNDKELKDISDEEIVFITASKLTYDVKLLNFEDAYYLDSSSSGAIFRQATYEGDDVASLSNLKLNSLPSKDSLLKVNQTGVTALTRVMQKKLASVGDPLYFSEKIKGFMSDADIVHVSNEVSFREGCTYSNVLFCSQPEFIKTLQDSGVNLVELTGNHNNDNGSEYNTETIKLYQSLGINTFGGGLNAEKAAEPYVADKKGSKITFLGYNAADGPNSGAVAGATSAGANTYSDEKAKADIAAAKQNSQFVIVDIQYSECQAYPSGYVEFPECDSPIGNQVEDFRSLIDMGADMVVGTQAHQPQTYELYKNKPIYYGLGNQYFEQTQWPGTERGIILTHYFYNGKLMQTKLTPTIYDKDLQTRVSNAEQAEFLLDRLNLARP